MLGLAEIRVYQQIKNRTLPIIVRELKDHFCLSSKVFSAEVKLHNRHLWKKPWYGKGTTHDTDLDLNTNTHSYRQRNKNSAGDETANMNFFTTTSYM